MGTKSRSLGIFLIFVAVIFGLYTWVTHADRAREQKAFDIGVEGYIYGYPLVLMNATKQAALHPNGPKPTPTAINTFAHVRDILTPAFKIVVSPNIDTLYSSAWLDLSSGPLLLHVPETTGRYYVMEMLDAWTNVFADPGTRTTGSMAGDFVIVGPQGEEEELPSNAVQIKASTNMAWIILRIECFGPADYTTVHALQDQFSLKPLNNVEAPAPLSLAEGALRSSPATQVSRMQANEFFGIMEGLLIANPPSPADTSIVDKLATIGLFPGKSFEKEEIDPAIDRGLERAVRVGQNRIKAGVKKTGHLVNGWRICNSRIGTYGTDYLFRASIASWVLGANLPEDALYPFTYMDADGNPLNGEHSYKIHFAKDQTPPVHAFWSITMYDADHFLIPNPMNRYAIQSHNKLLYNPDGSLDIIIQKNEPKEKVENWLPSSGGEFNLIMRMYWPKPEALDGAWAPPAVEKVS